MNKQTYTFDQANKRFALDTHKSAGRPFFTVQGFWECGCDSFFVHRTDFEPNCPHCGCAHGNCPDAMLEDVAHLPDLTVVELQVLVDKLVEVLNNPAKALIVLPSGEQVEYLIAALWLQRE